MHLQRSCLLLCSALFTRAQNAWHYVPNNNLGEAIRFEDVCFVTPLRGFAIDGSYGNVWKTDDGGDNWTR